MLLELHTLRKDNDGISLLKNKGGIFNEPKAKADILNIQYQSIFKQEHQDDVPSHTGAPLSHIEGI